MIKMSEKQKKQQMNARKSQNYKTPIKLKKHLNEFI